MEFLVNFDPYNFIQFGRILDKKKREGLISYWLYKTNRDTSTNIDYELIKDLSDYTKIIDKIVSNKPLLALIEKNDQIYDDITEKVFTTLEEVDKKTKLEGPFVEEELELLNWNKTNTKTLIKNSNSLVENIREYYSEDKINATFYEKEFEKIKEMEKEKKLVDKHAKEALRRELLNKWDSRLEEKKHLKFIEELDIVRDELLKKIYEQMEKLEKLMKILKPFTNELGRLWDLSTGLWRAVDFNILEKYAELLEKEPEIRKLAEYLGRMHEEQDELEEEIIRETIIQTKQRVNHAGKSELVGIHESADINNLLPNEMTFLTDKTTEILFYKKLAESKLLTYQFISREAYEEIKDQEKTKMVPKKNKRGPIIICVDTSGSMHGSPEHIAKVLCFAILKIALMHKRQCYLISFSTNIETLELTDLEHSLIALINFLTHSFHGGTNATPAFIEALKQIKTKEYSKADVLMISDFIMKKVDESILSKIQISKKDGTRFHSLVISSSGNPQALEFFDNNWIYNTQSNKPFKDVLKNIRYINTENNN